MRATVGTTLLIGFGGTLALAAVAGGVGVFGLTRTTAGTGVVSGLLGDLTATAEVSRGGAEVTKESREFMRARTGEAASAYDDRWRAFEKSLDALDAQITDASRRAILKDVRASAEAYHGAFGAVRQDLSFWRSTIVDRLHPMNVSIRRDVDAAARRAAEVLDADRALEVQAFARDYYNGLVSLKYFFALGNAEDAAEASRLLGAASATLFGLEGRIDDAALARSLEQIGSELASAVRLIGEVNAAQERAARAIDADLVPAERRFDDAVSRLSSALADAGGEERRAATATAGLATTTTVAATGLAVLVGGGFAFAVTRSLTSRMGRIRRELAGLTDASGRTDLTRTLTATGSDEIAQIAAAVNGVLGTIRGLVAETARASGGVAAATEQVGRCTNAIVGGITRQQQQTEQVAAAIEEMSASVAEVADQGNGAAGAARSSGEDAQRGGDVVRETVEQIRAIAAEVGETSRVVSELGAKGEQIGAIIAVINDIADQTNLLALNAAIEAARAGEHGRGFAVVADEVRKLAERTTSATEEVSRSIREIQEGTGTAVQRIEASSGRVGRGVELAGSAGAALDSIVQSSSGLLRMVESIAAAATEQSAASEQIARSVAEIRRASGESAASVEQVVQTATELSRDASALRSAIDRFRV